MKKIYLIAIIISLATVLLPIHIRVIITLVISLKLLCEKDYYKFIACSKPEDIIKEYSKKEFSKILVRTLLGFFGVIYELVFYLFLFLHIKTFPVLAFGVLHWGDYIYSMVDLRRHKFSFSEKAWRRRKVFCRIWAFSEIVFLGYLLYLLGWKNV